MHKLLLSILLLLPLTAVADVYQWTDAQGRTHFSDKPVHGAQKRQIAPVNTVTNPAFNLEMNTREMHFKQQGGSMRVEGRVNGVAMHFIVDTGATLVTIPPDIAKKAGIETTDARTITLRTANGEVSAPMVSIPEIDVDGVIQKNVQATIHQISSDGTLGLLGLSFFGNFMMTIDHKDKIIRLEKK